MPAKSRKTAHIVSLMTCLLLSMVVTSWAQHAQAQNTLSPSEIKNTDSLTLTSADLVRLIADDQVSQSQPVPPPPNFSRRQPNAAASATIVINYIDAPSTWDLAPQAKTAFQFAVDIWETQIDSPVNIVVDAYWIPLSTGVLGSSGPYSVIRNQAGFPQTATWYPIALANAITGTDLNGSSPEIVAQFNSSYLNWYFGTGAITPSTDYNFASVVLHELGHGLGFVGSMNKALTVGEWGYSASLPLPVNSFIYDHSTENGAGQGLLSFPNFSTVLGDQLTSEALYFNGPKAVAANGGNRVALYAPSVWRSGSSYSHLAESFNGTPNALMTYSLSRGETNYSPGPVMLGILQDMGWTSSLVYQPPTFLTLPGQLLLMNESRPDALNLAAYTKPGTGGSSNPTYSLTHTSNPNAGVTLSGSMISIAPALNWVGSATVEVSVADGVGSDSASFNVVVAEQLFFLNLPVIAR